MNVISLYLIILNLITFLYYGVDKAKSRRGNRRISEKTLLLLALLGGSAGALLGMKTFRHKTKKLSFQAWIALILVLQIWFIYFIFQESSLPLDF